MNAGDGPADTPVGFDDLADLDALPVAEHVERFAALHDDLVAALATIDEV